MSEPWCVNVANNPNINREPPPPGLNSVQGSAPAPAAAAAATSTQTVVEHQQAPIYGPPIPINVAPPVGLGLPFGAGFGLGGMMMDPISCAVGGPLAPIRSGNFMPGTMGGIGFGIHATGGVPFPPPPPGAHAAGMMPFAPMAPLWQSGGLAFGNVPTGVVPPMMDGMMGGMMGGMAGYQPAPIAIDGNGGFPEQPKQNDFTEMPGGIPCGATHVEPETHTLFYQIKGNVCPWLSPGAQFVTELFHIACPTGLNRMIQVCNNNASPEECENTAITECLELGNGMWEKGQTFKYNDAVCRILTNKDAGWDNTRNREGGQSLYLWCHQI